MRAERFLRHGEQLMLGELSDSRGELKVCGWAFKLCAFPPETGSVFNSRVMSRRNKRPKAALASPAL